MHGHQTNHIHSSGGSRNFERRFPLVVDPRCRGLGVQPPAAEDVLIFISIQSNENSTLSYRQFYWLATFTCSSYMANMALWGKHLSYYLIFNTWVEMKLVVIRGETLSCQVANSVIVSHS